MAEESARPTPSEWEFPTRGNAVTVHLLSGAQFAGTVVNESALFLEIKQHVPQRFVRIAISDISAFSCDERPTDQGA